ncbi:MAG TPA: MFS transporter [Solirubrobacteraceae bacterium]|nr:MFS transporter [Solirubrobacteraceae bacterium]
MDLRRSSGRRRLGGTDVPRSSALRKLAPPGGRDAALLLIARVLMSAQRALIGVILPIYLARRGFSAPELGALFSVVALASAALSALVGIGADRVGRRVFVICMPLLSAAAAFAYAFAAAPAALFSAAALGSFGRGGGAGGGQIGPYQPAEQALLTGMVQGERMRNRLFGLIASASAAGGLLGSVLAVTPLTKASGRTVDPATYRPVFLAAALLAVLAGACALKVGERSPGWSGRLKSAAGAEGTGGERRACRGPGPRRAAAAPPRRLSASSRRLVRRLWVTNAVNGAAVGLFGPFITYWLYRRYGAGPAEIGALYTVANLITIATNLLAAPLARVNGTVPTVVAIRASQALLLPVLALMPTLAAAGAVYTFRLVIQRIGVALRQSFVMGAAPAAERARVAAFSQLPAQGVSALSPTLSGYLFAQASLAAPFALAGALQLLNAILFYAFFGGVGPGGPSKPADQAGAGDHEGTAVGRSERLGATAGDAEHGASGFRTPSRG